MSHYDDLQYRLQELAIEITQNFCSQCPQVLKDVFCPMTGSDEFVRKMKGVGAEYDLDWVVKFLIQHHCSPVTESDKRVRYDEMLNDCNPAVKIGEFTFFPSEVVKKVAPLRYKVKVT
ncbi:MAG: hypothetical protein GY850_41045, partial [bacterium]|nr:hypothetical protein [bacterium]